MPQSRDLFDDSTMSFGEHLEELRTHLIKAIIGLVITVVICLFFGQDLVAVVRSPIDQALQRYGVSGTDDVDEGFDAKAWMIRKYHQSKAWMTGNEVPKEYLDPEPEEPETEDETEIDPKVIEVTILKSDARALLGDEAKAGEEKEQVRLKISADEFAQLKRAVVEIDKPKTFNVQEAFMTYLKVSLVFGLVFASPWVLFQAWSFVAAGLYPHERKYVYLYLPLSIFLFTGGAVFCFFIVFPFILDFLLGFNLLLGVQPQIRLSEWISFAVMLPVMFGVSFQLPLVMLFLERINVFEVKMYRENRRFAILIISIVSMVLSPPDPASMVFMLVPLVLLYELGIWFCVRSQKPENPLAEEAS